MEVTLIEEAAHNYVIADTSWPTEVNDGEGQVVMAGE